jgi:hypothetical protein
MIIKNIKSSITEEHIAWLKRALHTEVQFAVLKCSHLHGSVEMLRPNGDRLLSKLNPCVSCAQTPLILQAEKTGTFSYVEPDDDLSSTMHEYLTRLYVTATKINQAINDYRHGSLGIMVWKPLTQTFVKYGKDLFDRHNLKEKQVQAKQQPKEYSWGGANEGVIVNLKAILERETEEKDDAFSARVFGILGNNNLNSVTGVFLSSYDDEASHILDMLKNAYPENNWKKTVGVITKLQKKIREIRASPAK